MRGWKSDPCRVWIRALENLLLKRDKKSRFEARSLLGLVSMRRCPICRKMYRFDVYHRRACSKECEAKYKKIYSRVYRGYLKEEKQNG